MRKYFIYIALLTVSINSALAQSSIQKVDKTNMKDLTASRRIINKGQIIYNTTNTAKFPKGMYLFSGTDWQKIELPTSDIQDIYLGVGIPNEINATQGDLYFNWIDVRWWLNNKGDWELLPKNNIEN